MRPARQHTRDWPAPYVSVACRMGTHTECTEGNPRPVPRSSAVIYEICTCTWCHPRYEGATPNTTGPVVSISSETVRPGDVIQIGGQPFEVADMVALPHQAKQLRFETGETLTMHIRTRLAAVRMRGRGW
ncbi:hypothetical protein GCM10012287_56470 [Streptomyces daqingensis]|uniref:Uncharacterized protein n=1 Tax=Streptomyces daqingensis TaxID=1472640 RepID=A0ABQ2MV00_9ACTN|nr:hypothetical protein GCM10012287_56470 [Streptomyces daqingensis]